jgi:SAM-dependent methyltransferase
MYQKILHILQRIIRHLQIRPTVLLFKSDISDYQKLNNTGRFPINNQDLLPCLNDKTKQTFFDTHYIYHPAWAARILKNINPNKHIDISSTLSFCSVISAFIPTEFYDYRPADIRLSNLVSTSADLTALPFIDNSIESLSCMHTIEHIGLGRYGDKLAPDGDLIAINELKRVLKKSGNLLIVTPVGKPRLQFNAHRIYSYEMILSHFQGFKLKDFSLVTDSGIFNSPSNSNDVENQSYGCGCFWFEKLY